MVYAPKTLSDFWRTFQFWLAGMLCTYVVAVCDAAVPSLRWGPGRVHHVIVVPNGAPPAPCGSSPAGGNRNEQGFRLIHVARLNRYKDQASLLRALALARTRAPDLLLWIAGDGPEAHALHALCSELRLDGCVSFLGERDDVGRWLQQADLFVLSSLTEGLPMSLLEALAAGLPFVVTEVGGMPEVARLSGAGVTVPPGQPGRLAEAILEYAEHRDRLPALRQAARQCYERHFTADLMADRYLNLYQQRPV